MSASPSSEPPVVDVTLAAALLRLFPDAPPRLEMAASTVRELLDALNERWPGMRDRLSDETPRLRRHINIFVNGERARLETPLQPGASVFIITAISGG